MLSLHFQLGADRFAIDIAAVVEVLPLLHIRPLPHSNPFVAGVFNYRGAPVPAIDLSQVTCGRPAVRRMSTRIVLLRYTDADHQPQLVGLIAEGVKAALSRESARPGAPAGGGVAHAAQVTTDAEGLLHWLDVRAVMTTAELSVEHATVGS